MTQDAIRKQMDGLWARAREELLGVMDKAEVGDIISGTEWEVRAIQQRLARQCFELMVQNRVDGLDQTPQGAFSPAGDGAAMAGPSQSRSTVRSGSSGSTTGSRDAGSSRPTRR